jgi:hypothetical protein
MAVARQVATWSVFSGVLADLMLTSGGETSVALPPKAIKARRRGADYHLMLRIENVEPPARRPTERLGTCRLHGEVIEVMRGDGRLGPADRVEVDINCWPFDDIKMSLPGPNRIHYGDPALASRLLEIWLMRREDSEVLLALDWIER